MKKVLRVVIILLGFVIAGLIGWRLALLKQKAGSMVPSQPMPSVQPFSFTDQNGKLFGLQDLKDHVWLANFIFTRCMGPCPVITAQMAELEKEFADRKDIRFVSFSVDPDYDTPEILSQYAETYGAKAPRWRFLTGPREKMYELIRSSFLLAVQENPNAKTTNPGEAVVHSLNFVLVDKEGRIHGYYNSTDPEAMKKLRADLKNLS